MSKKQDRLMVVQQIHTAADLYRKNLVAKNFYMCLMVDTLK